MLAARTVPAATSVVNRLYVSLTPWAAVPRGTASRTRKPAARATGSSQRRHGAVWAWPPGPGGNMRIEVLLRPGGTPGTLGVEEGRPGRTGLPAGPAGADQPGRLYSPARAPTRPGPAAQLPPLRP